MLDRGGYLICETARCFKRPSRRLSAKLEQRLRAREAAASAHADAPILIAARKCRLNPEPSATSSWGWSVRCPGTNHSLMISTKDNTFGCGYCKRQGGPEELRAFAAERKAKS